MQVFKLLLGLIFASGTVIVFSDIPADLTAAQMIAACYQNGANAWLGGGVLGTLLGGNLLLLSGCPAPPASAPRPGFFCVQTRALQLFFAFVLPFSVLTPVLCSHSIRFFHYTTGWVKWQLQNADRFDP